MIHSYQERPAKRRRLSLPSDRRRSAVPSDTDTLVSESDFPSGKRQAVGDESITISSTTSLAGQSIAPFLTKHIPQQYAPLGTWSQSARVTNRDPNSKFCYRHRPDLKCRRQADEPSMDQLQHELETLSQGDQQGIAHVWALFSAAPSKHRKLMLQGILAQCCFPQLSYISARARELICIDFVSALPAELAFKILCYLDTTSLCKAAQVSQRWRILADDDVVWHRMCEQHIHRKCTKCGWGLPLLERKRLRASKRQTQLRAAGRGLSTWPPNAAQHPESGPQEGSQATLLGASASNEPGKGVRASDADCSTPRLRPWKDVYKDRFKVGSNWKHGRYSTRVLKGHTNGVMCLQFDDHILATGSYDSTIKIWDLESGTEIRTLRGHGSGVRCLQFDDTKLISGSLDKTLKVWNWHTGECLRTLTGHCAGVISLHFVDKTLVSGSMDSTIRIWNFEDKSTCVLRGHTDWVNAVRLDMASRTLFSASDDLSARLWDVDTKAAVRIFEGHVGQVQQVLPLAAEYDLEEAGAVAGAGEDSGSSRGSISGASSSSSPPPPPPSSSSGGSPFGSRALLSSLPGRPPPPRYMVTGALDSTIRLWEVSTGRCLRICFGHVEGVWALAADTLRMVSGAEDRTVKVWDVRTGRCERTFTGHAGPVTCVGLGDSRMCTGSEDGEVRVYGFKIEADGPTEEGARIGG